MREFESHTLRHTGGRPIASWSACTKGTFVFHCHMLALEDRGMMGVIRVE